MFMDAGTYLVEKTPPREWMSEDLKPSFVSIDKEISVLHPDFFGSTPYLNWLVGREVYYHSTFSSSRDAKSFKKTFLKEKENVVIVKLGIQLEDAELILNHQLDPQDVSEQGISGLLSEKRLIGPHHSLLGYDIMGYECATFFSFRTNHLEGDIRNRVPFETNEVGLIKEFVHAKKGADMLNNEDFGQEEVDWFAWALFEVKD
ncbi:hypothetical protein [Shouchella lonarensis]|uniref:Uncharacterized protein n=1 Tax=Shouchella lonarensis TaxID=1464122 RepID=A0A1G6GKQ5_9BACI|nr:hypothetical protein [Shouchella lonarensis]SDB82325.1 hypothetical protein SAMN05421737_101170 [Shouchella lonarensis]